MAKTNPTHTLITGGAGFIGSSLADSLLTRGQRVTVFDNLSRPGAAENIERLKTRHGDRLRLIVGDVRDPSALAPAIATAAYIFHLAAQVAVTTSLVDPKADFHINCEGTINVLDALLKLRDPPPLIYTSTNKVYGQLSGVSLRETKLRYIPQNKRLCSNGISEDCKLDFQTPYGCSKGSADQYVLSHSRNFGLQAVVLRLSCIYGPRQFGDEHQGWVSHFVKRTSERKCITIHGNGKQVRDLLHIDDLVNALTVAAKKCHQLSGKAFNVGGGSHNTTSLLELLQLVTALTGEEPSVEFAHWRPSDQRYYVSDTRRFGSLTKWAPKISITQGLKLLVDWRISSQLSRSS